MTTPEQPPPPAPAAPPAKPSMKRWKKITLITAGILVGLVGLVLAAGPAVIGAVAESKIPSILQDQFQATATVGNVSFSWSGRIRIDDLRMVPKSFSDPLIEVKKVDVKVALGSAIGGKYIADVEVTAPKILVEKGADGTFNYEFPPSRTKPAKPKSGGKDEDRMPFVQANLKVRDGQVTIRGRGRETVTRKLTADVKVDTLEKPIGYDVTLDELRVNGAIDISKVSGPATVKIDRLPLKNLTGAVRAYSDVDELDGTVSGTFDYQLESATQFTGKGNLEVEGCSAVLKGRNIRLDRVTVAHVGEANGKHMITLESGKALAVTVQADVNESTVRATLSGSSDLGELGRKLEKLIGLKPDMALEGAATIRGTVEAKGAESAKTDLTASLSNVVAVDTKTGKKADIDRAIDLRVAGAWDGTTKTVTADVLRLTSSFATMDGKGGAALGGTSPEIKASTFQLQADLEKLGAKLAHFMESPPGLKGSVLANASTAGDRYTLDAAAKGLQIATTGPMDGMVAMAGVISVKPDLLTVTAQTKPDGLKFEWITKGYLAKATLDTQVTCTATGTTGTTKLTNLEIVDDRKNVIRDPVVTIVHDIGLADKTIDLRKTEVSSSFLRGTIGGKIVRQDGAMQFQKVRLLFKYLPDKLGAVAKPWLPGKLEGTEEKDLDITFDGKAASTDVLSILRGTTGGIDVDLARFTMEGLSVSGKTQFKLQGGKLTSGAPLTVNQGRTDLNASIDFNPVDQKPQSSLTFHARGVDANGQMGPILERINPIFRTQGIDAKVDGKIDGEFKLLWTGVVDPSEKSWVDAASRSLSGSGTFAVQDLNVAGSPAVGQIMSAMGQGNALSGELIATQIQIGAGRCTYENMMLRGSRKDPAALKRDQEQVAADRQQLEADKPQLNPREYAKRVEELRHREEDLPFRYTLKFSGWVGFDRKMQLRVLMPMTANMIKSYPNLQKYIGSSFWVDLTGTTESPKLDVSKMIAEAAKRAAEGVLAEKAADLLGGLFKNKKRESEAESLVKEAQQAETDQKRARAIELYKKALADYKDTEYVRKRKAALESRLSLLQGK